MGDPVPISLGFRTNKARNQQGGNAQLINCYAEEIGQDGKVTIAIYATEGEQTFGSELVGGGIRAIFEVEEDENVIVVAGGNVYRVNSSGVGTLLGGLVTTGPVYMARNRKVPTQVGIVSDGLYYVIDTTSYSMTQIVDPDLPSPISIDVSDGYGIIPVVNGEFYLTGIDGLTTIDGLDVGTAEAYPDEIVRNLVIERELILFGTRSIEWHQNTGNADFPYERVHAIEIGCLAGNSVAKVDTPIRKTAIWVCPDHTVRMLNGYGADVISDNGMHELIKTLDRAGRASELRGMAWAYGGLFFYALTCDDWTRVFDSKTDNWHTRKSYGDDRWRINAISRLGNKLIGGHFDRGQLYSLDTSFRDAAGEYQVMDVITPTISAFPHALKFNGLYLDAATGVGLNSTDPHESDPKVLVSWSDDGGASWAAEYERSMGTDGKITDIKPIYRMGKCRDKGRMYRFRISAPVERVMLQASIDYDQLTA